MTVTGTEQRVYGTLVNKCRLKFLTTFTLGYYYSANATIADANMNFNYIKKTNYVYICSVLNNQWYGYRSYVNYFTSPIKFSFNKGKCKIENYNETSLPDPIPIYEQIVDGLLRCEIKDIETNALVYKNYIIDNPNYNTENVDGWAHGLRDIGQYMEKNKEYNIRLWLNYHFFDHRFTSYEDLWIFETQKEIEGAMD